jgi:hypothetical protein
MEYAIKMNACTEHIRGLSVFYDGWRRVAESLFYIEPPGFIDEFDKQRLIVHLMEVILEKVKP